MIDTTTITAEHDNYIGIYKNVYPPGYCQHLISEFERMKETGAGIDRLNSEGADLLQKHDYQIHLNITPIRHFDGKAIDKIFFKGLQVCFDKYAEEFPSLKHSKTRATHMKMQRTCPGGGYHLWHSEQGNGEEAKRSIVYMLYLNTLEPGEAGETEFIYQRKRIKPEENVMLIWPASYTHTHRGNTVLGERYKYVVTGWFYNT